MAWARPEPEIQVTWGLQKLLAGAGMEYRWLTGALHRNTAGSPAPPVLVHVLVLVLAVALLVHGGAVVGGDERLGLLLEQPDELVSVRGGGRIMEAGARARVRSG